MKPRIVLVAAMLLASTHGTVVHAKVIKTFEFTFLCRDGACDTSKWTNADGTQFALTDADRADLATCESKNQGKNMFACGIRQTVEHHGPKLNGGGYLHQ